MATNSAAAAPTTRSRLMAGVLIVFGAIMASGSVLAQQQKHESHVTDPAEAGKQHAIHGGKNVQPTPDHVKRRQRRPKAKTPEPENHDTQRQPEAAAPATDLPRR